uniref:Uncharacterized protein n=1 Tax=Rhizophora mucronata TaxID=61149 RepID=A0A2P2ILY4_RHIMU
MINLQWNFVVACLEILISFIFQLISAISLCSYFPYFSVLFSSDVIILQFSI